MQIFGKNQHFPGAMCITSDQGSSRFSVSNIDWDHDESSMVKVRVSVIQRLLHNFFGLTYRDWSGISIYYFCFRRYEFVEGDIYVTTIRHENRRYENL
jgi:hypothetical protein